ncbi:MAG TPA: hypothetical protein VK662_01235 [Acidothermaceae bacterium]|jgi:hypothetical protein|nr:hypothetical protein [Acidothermaceae bacterium]
MPRLTAIGLQRADLPAGWKASAPDPDPDAAATSAELAQCAGGVDNYPDETGDSTSDDYSLGNATISSDVISFRSQADVADDVAIMKSPNVDACYVKFAENDVSIPAGASLDSVSFLIVPGSAGGPSNVVGNGAATLEVSGSGGDVGLYDNMVLITGPSIEAEVDFSNVGSPVPAKVRAAVTAKVAARVAAAAAAAARAGAGAQT